MKRYIGVAWKPVYTLITWGRVQDGGEWGKADSRSDEFGMPVHLYLHDLQEVKYSTTKNRYLKLHAALTSKTSNI